MVMRSYPPLPIITRICFWYALREQGVTVKVITPSGESTAGVSVEDIAREITGHTRLVAVSKASNVLGIVQPVKKITKIAHEYEALCLVDGAQSVPHIKIIVSCICFYNNHLTTLVQRRHLVRTRSIYGNIRIIILILYAAHYNMKDIGCDFLCFSGHKMLGPTGTGVLWMTGESIEPLLLGGGMINEVTRGIFLHHGMPGTKQP